MSDCQSSTYYQRCAKRVQELQVLWEQVLEGLQAEDSPATAKSILKFAYFWYNFMPLARGTAAAGYIFILSMFLAAGMPVSASIPKASLQYVCIATVKACRVSPLRSPDCAAVMPLQ